MKNIFIFLFLIHFGLLAQKLPTDSTTGKFVVTDFVEIPGMQQKDLHDKTQQYLIKTYKVPTSTILEDKDDKIVLKGFKKINVKTDKLNTAYPLHFLLTVTFKNGAYRYKATDFSPDGINHYNLQSLKHPDDHKFKNKKDKEAYLMVYNSYVEGMQKIGKDLQTGINRSITAKVPVSKK